MTPAPLNRLGIVGAGTMGAGIAETAIRLGLAVTLVDSSEEMLARASQGIRESLAKAVERSRLTPRAATCAEQRLRLAPELEALAECGAVIEAISERLDAKRELFLRLSAICPAPAILATNTSSLRVSAIAAGIDEPERVVGMHFFNPVTRMELVEVVPGAETSEETTNRARQLGEALGKRVIVAADGIGFLVNRCARPFANEALRLVQERVASFDQVDRICRLAGGFRMGPFELVDLIGLDVNLEINESFWFQSYGEPRWKPSPIQARMVDAGRVGRKSGVGFYDYRDGPHRPADPEPERPPGGGEGRTVSIAGEGVVAEALRDRAGRAGFEVRGRHDPEPAWLAIDARTCAHDSAPVPSPRTILCAATDLAGCGDPRAGGFHLIGPIDDRVRLVETTALSTTDPVAMRRADELFAALGFLVERVGDAPGLVLGRIVSQLVNEAGFVVGEGAGAAADVDTGTTLGLNFPRGPVAWADAAGMDHVRAVLTALYASRGEERYRLAPQLRSGFG